MAPSPLSALSASAFLDFAVRAPGAEPHQPVSCDALRSQASCRVVVRRVLAGQETAWSYDARAALPRCSMHVNTFTRTHGMTDSALRGVFEAASLHARVRGGVVCMHAEHRVGLRVQDDEFVLHHLYAGLCRNVCLHSVDPVTVCYKRLA